MCRLPRPSPPYSSPGGVSPGAADMEDLRPVLSLAVLCLGTVVSVLIRYRTVRKKRSADGTAVLGESCRAMHTDEAEAGPGSTATPQTWETHADKRKISNAKKEGQKSENAWKEVIIKDEDEGQTQYVGDGEWMLFGNSGCIMNGSLVKEKIKQSVLKRDVCFSCGSPKLQRKGGCVCVLKLYHRKSEKPASLLPTERNGYSNFRLQPWDTAPSVVRRRINRKLKPEVQTIGPRQQEVAKEKENIANGKSQRSVGFRGERAPIAVMEPTGTPNTSVKGILKDSNCHMMTDGRSTSSGMNDGDSSAVENPSRLSLLSNITVQSAPPSCYRTPEVTRINNNVTSLTDMRGKNDYPCDPEDGLIMDSFSEEKRSVSSFVLDLHNGQILRVLTLRECFRCTSLPLEGEDIPAEMKFLQLSPDDYNQAMKKLNSCSKLRYFTPLYNRWLHSSFLAGLFLVVWVMGVLAAISRDTDPEMAAGVSFLSGILVVMVIVWICLRMRKKMNDSARTIITGLNEIFSKYNVIVGMVDTVGCMTHTLQLYFVYFKVEGCLEGVRRFLDLPNGPSISKVHTKISENGSMMFTELGYVPATANKSENEKQDASRLMMAGICGEYVDKLVKDSLKYINTSGMKTDCHARDSPCICQYLMLKFSKIGHQVS